MNQADITKVVSKLRFKLHDRRKLQNIDGPQGRHNKIRKIVTALFKHERLEINYPQADEARGYAERLISDAIRYGDCHKETMEMANYWILEKQLVHKLFKVLAPRYQNSTLSYTKLWKIPQTTPGMEIPKCIIELRNNIYPPLGPDKSNHKNLIHNVLLSEARKAFEKEKLKKKLASEQAVQQGKEHSGEEKEGDEVIKAADKLSDLKITNQKIDNLEVESTEPIEVKSEKNTENPQNEEKVNK